MRLNVKMAGVARSAVDWDSRRRSRIMKLLAADSKKYIKGKEAKFKRYDINEETYRRDSSQLRQKRESLLN